MVATKKELIELVAEKAEFTKKDAEKAINATLDAIKELTAEKDAVSLIGFGKFEKRHRAERQGQNPQTKQTITIPASTTVGFNVGASFKEAVK